MVAQEKHDGCYSFSIIRAGDYRIMSRTGKSTFVALAHLSEQLKRMHEELTPWADFSPCMLIAEVKANNPDGTPMSAAAIAGRCQDESVLFPEAFMVVHDCIPYKDFLAGHSDVPYCHRWDVASSIARKLDWKCSTYQLVPCEPTARAFAQRIIDAGGEGAVFKQPDAQWTAGKKNELYMKIKQELSYDLRVTGMTEGEGKYSGTLGTLTLHFRRFGKADGEQVTVLVSGMTDKQRDDWWNCREQIIGQIVQVDAMRFTEFGMLREPRFKGIRFDKDCADIV